MYVPPRTQIVSPGCTLPPPPASAVRRSQGLVMLPDAPLEPAAEAYQPTRTGGGGVTVTTAEPDFPSTVAITVSVPAATPTTNPLLPTDVAALLVVHRIVRPESALPAESRGVALSGP